jgi:hypothetical protein
MTMVAKAKNKKNPREHNIFNSWIEVDLKEFPDQVVHE